VNRAALTRWSRVAVTVAVLACAAGYIGRDMAGHGDETLRALAALRPLPVALAMVAVCAGVVITALSWREPLQAVSQPIGAADAVRLFAAGQLGKYVPGVMWSVVLQAQLAARNGITLTQMGVTFGVYAVVSISTGAAIGFPATAGLAGGGSPSLAVAMVAVAAAVAGLLPWLLRQAARLPVLRARLTPVPAGPLRRSVLLCGGSWLVSGLHLWVLAIALGASPTAALLPCVGGFALATVAGTLAFLVPDGLGVREGVLTVVLSSCLPPPAALVVATGSRVLLAASDVIMFVYGSWSARRARAGLAQDGVS
jgi:hypothetical protein